MLGPIHEKRRILRALGLAFALTTVIVGLPLLDQMFVKVGERHARNLCIDPGPLQIYDREAWDNYSSRLRNSLPHDPIKRRKVRNEIRQGMGISEHAFEVNSHNPLLVTVRYVRQELRQGGKIIAALNYYRSDDIGPIISFIALDGPSGGYSCIQSSKVIGTEF